MMKKNRNNTSAKKAIKKLPGDVRACLNNPILKQSFRTEEWDELVASLQRVIHKAVEEGLITLEEETIISKEFFHCFGMLDGDGSLEDMQFVLYRKENNHG